MPYSIIPTDHSFRPCTDLQGFKPSCLTVVEGAFTEYQMDALIHGLQDAVEQWNPAALAISYLPTLFSGYDGRRLLEPLVEHLKLLTVSSGIITAITSFGGSWYGDRLECALNGLIFKTHVSRGYDEYRQFNNQMAAMKQLKVEGIETMPGQNIHYIITDHKSRNYQKRNNWTGL
jgi:hypothetical protein